MFKIGDLVTRKKYNNDVVFRIEKIDGNNVYLVGIDIRLCADAEIDDLVYSSDRSEEDEDNLSFDFDNDFFYIPGVVLHIDADINYLKKCVNFYKKYKIKCYGYLFDEDKMPLNVNKLLFKYNPDIVVITGHDFYHKDDNSYLNSNYFIECARNIRDSFGSNIIIIAGACQSDFKGLLEAGATFASSPGHSNIHALDPAIIACSVALCPLNRNINLKSVISKTKYGFEGIGGVSCNGVMKYGFPRKGILN
jgi:spore coat assembly protein